MRVFLVITAVLALSILLALNIGSSGFSLWQLGDPLAAQIIWHTRLPRILLAAGTGYALSVAGTAYQTLLQNPLADPYLLGVAGGAGLGSALALACGAPWWGVIAGAFVASLGMMQLLLWWTQRHTQPLPSVLLLLGAASNAFTFALILLVQALLPVAASQQLLFVLMGNFTSASPEILLGLGISCALGTALLLPHATMLDLLALGRDTTRSLGYDLPRVERRLFVAGSLLVGSAVAVSGLVGFVGLFIPHAVRLLVGHSHRRLLPAAGLLGAAFLILADTIARSVMRLAGTMTELPIGAVTALIGAPCFLWLLTRTYGAGARE